MSGDLHEGARTVDPLTGRTLEWSGGVWTPVCPEHDTAMTGVDEHGWICCDEQKCGLRAADLPRSVR